MPAASGLLASLSMDPSEPRCGVTRPTMGSNVLLTKTGLSKSKKLHCSADLPEDHAYGLAKARDPEGAREVSMSWQYHEANPDSQPGPNFVAMNKGAAMEGLTKATQQRPYRVENPVKVELGMKESPKPELPSDNNEAHTYGRRSANRPFEEVRLTGQQPDMVDLMQGQYSSDWVKMNMTRREEFEEAHEKIEPMSTRASVGHAMNSAKAVEAQREPFKLKKFGKVTSKVSTRR
ncbi:flagellar associated protein [Pycnococcus provasolii]